MSNGEFGFEAGVNDAFSKTLNELKRQRDAIPKSNAAKTGGAWSEAAAGLKRGGDTSRELHRHCADSLEGWAAA